MFVQKVSRHAVTRFQQRVCAIPDAYKCLMHLWRDSNLADDDIMKTFQQERRAGSEYRLAQYNNVRFILIAANGAIVTLVTLATAHPDSGRWKIEQRDKDRKRRREIDMKARRSKSKRLRIEDSDDD